MLPLRTAQNRIFEHVYRNAYRSNQNIAAFSRLLGINHYVRRHFSLLPLAQAARLPLLLACSRGAEKTVHDLDHVEVAQIRRNDNPSGTARCQLSTLCRLHKEAKKSILLWNSKHEDQVEPIVLPEKGKPHEGIIVPCQSRKR